MKLTQIPSHFQKISIYFFLVSSTFTFYCYYKIILDAQTSLPSNQGQSDEEQPKCRLPKLDPFHQSVKPFLVNETLNCSSGWKELFKTDFDSNLYMLKDPMKYGFKKCCYKSFHRFPGNDQSSIYSSTCTPIVNKITKIPKSIEFIGIYCLNTKVGRKKVERKIVDMFGFVHKMTKSKSTNEKKMNIVILGLDSISHMNFPRMMPKTYNYLTTNLSGIGMNGYTKVGDNTFPNLIPVLSGISVDELVRICWENSKVQFDKCPFIWKKFSEEGYWTSFGEDAPGMGIFNYIKQGFKNPPTDFYLRPLVKQMEQKIGNHRDVNSMVCYGPRLAFTVLLDYMMKTAYTMNKTEPYFQLIWASSLFHDFLNFPQLGDTPLVSMLQWFNNNGHFENTAFILMSDHGMRFGGFRETRQGSIEDRMPFLYFILPKWFQKKYPIGIQQLQLNTNRLTSPFDLHETLLDLLYTKRIPFKSEFGKGISHFRQFPMNRTCSDAGIADQWCVCAGEGNKLIIEVPIDDTPVLKGAATIIQSLNSKISNHTKKCSMLELKEILHAEVYTSTTIVDLIYTDAASLTLTIKTLPGKGVFEAKLLPSLDSKKWKVSGEVNRVNLYGNQSHCIDSAILKKYCYCNIQL